MAELYDLENDPGELVNLRDSEHDVARSLDKSLSEFLETMRPPPPAVADTGDKEKDKKELLRQLKAVGYM
jgi:hypothetical protein